MSLLNSQHYKVEIKESGSIQGKEVAPSPTLRCCSYYKGSFRVAFDYGRPTYLYLTTGELQFYYIYWQYCITELVRRVELQQEIFIH